MIFTFGFFSFRNRPTPLMVPPVPMPQTKCVILPSVSSQISGPGGVVVRFGIHGVFVLVRIIRIGNFARQFFRHGIIAARIIRLDGRGAHDDFRAKRFQQIHFFLRLLVGDGENHFVAAHRGDQRQSHAGISGCALDNRAAGFQQASALGIINHRDADAILHRAAGIQVVHFDVDFRRQALAVMRFNRTSGVCPMDSRMFLHFMARLFFFHWSSFTGLTSLVRLLNSRASAARAAEPSAIQRV